VLTELQHRGVGDILIACVDGLKGFPDAINACSHKPMTCSHELATLRSYTGVSTFRSCDSMG
jgi:hypothetical protein